VSAAEATPADGAAVVEVFAGKELSGWVCAPASNFSLLLVVGVKELSGEGGDGKDASRFASSGGAEARETEGIPLLLLLPLLLPPPVGLLPPRGALPPPAAVLPDGAEDDGVGVPEAAGGVPVRRASSSACKRPRIWPSGARRRISINLTSPISS